MTLTHSLRHSYLAAHPVAAARSLEAITGSELSSTLAPFDAHTLAPVLDNMSTARALAAFDQLERSMQLDVVQQASPRLALAVLESLPESQRDALLADLDEVTRQDLTRLLQFEENTAGRLLERPFDTIREDMTVAEVLARVRDSRLSGARCIYVVDAGNRLVGRADMQALALAQGAQLISELLVAPEGVALLTSTREEIVQMLQGLGVDSIPVVDADRHLMGVVRFRRLFEAIEKVATADLQKMVGASADEKALSGAWFSVRRRLPWLHINLLTAFAAAAVVGLFESLIAQFTALAVLLPVVAGQSGNAGSQALAVTMRGLALREIGLREWRRVLTKEVKVGMIDGAVLAVTCGLGVMDANLLLNASTTFTGDPTTLDGEGTISHEADFAVDGPVSVNTSFYNIGGAFNDNTITINDDFDLAVERISLSTAVVESFEGTLNINSGTFTVDNAADQWLFTGTAVFSGEGASPSIAGDTINADGATISVVTKGRVAADFNADGTTIDVSDGGELTLDGVAVVGVDSTLDLNNTGHLVIGGNAVVRQPDFAWNGRDTPTTTTTVHAGGVLTLEVDRIDPAGDHFDAVANLEGGRLVVDVAGDQWVMRGTLNLDSSAGTPAVAGDPVVLEGTVHVSGPSAPTFEAHTTYTASTNLVFAPDTSPTIDHTGPFTIEPGATFPPGFTIASSAPHTLPDGSTFPFPLNPLDELRVGTEPATATVPALQLTPTSVLHVQIDTPSPAATPPAPGVDHDLLVVTEAATLDGTLNVEFLDRHGGLPAVGTEYRVMTYGSRVEGTSFTRASGVLINTSLALVPLITDSDGDLVDDAVVLRVSVPGDVNLDNQVTISDLSTFALNFDTTAPNGALYDDESGVHSWEIGDFNGDGSVTIADLSLLALNFGFGFMPDGSMTAATGLSLSTAARLAGIDERDLFVNEPFSTDVPEPGSFALVLSLIGFGVLPRVA